jgi:NAD+ synthase
MINRDYKKLHDDLVQWIRDWFEENGKGCNAIFGVSGGKDSLMIGALCAEALGKDRVIGIGMPDTGQGLNDADEICKYLGIRFVKIPIGEITNTFKGLWYDMGDEDFKWSKQSEQNIPPRIRMVVLYAYAQTMNGRVVGTTNLDERLTGYFTKYGDGLASDVEPIEMLTVNEILKIGEYMGLPSKWLHKVPSADIPHTKTDEEELGFSYEDFGNYIRGIKTPSEEIVNKMEERMKKNAFKLKPIAHFIPE